MVITTINPSEIVVMFTNLAIDWGPHIVPLLFHRSNRPMFSPISLSDFFLGPESGRRSGRTFLRSSMPVSADFGGSDHVPHFTLWKTNITMERSTIFNGKIHYFYGHFFNGYVTNYQRVVNYY